MITIMGLCTIPACVHKPRWSQKAYAEKVQHWVGKDIRELINTFGYPDKVLKSPDELEVYEYVNVRLYRSPESFYTHIPLYGGTATTHRLGGDITRSICKTWFEIQGQKVVKVQFRGDLCLAPEQTP